MDIGSVLVLLAVAILAAAFVARPLVETRSADLRPQDRRLSAVQAELERVLATIQELDMDYAMEKLGSREYQAQREGLVGRGANLMRQRDELLGGTVNRALPGSLDALIEAEVSRLRGRAGEPASFCGNCGQPAMQGDRFCVRCGAILMGDEARP